MSQRTKKIVKLASEAITKGCSSNYNDDCKESSDSFNSSSNSNLVSNWVIEVDPQILKGNLRDSTPQKLTNTAEAENEKSNYSSDMSSQDNGEDNSDCFKRNRDHGCSNENKLSDDVNLSKNINAKTLKTNVLKSVYSFEDSIDCEYQQLESRVTETNSRTESDSKMFTNTAVNFESVSSFETAPKYADTYCTLEKNVFDFDTDQNYFLQPAYTENLETVEPAKKNSNKVNILSHYILEKNEPSFKILEHNSIPLIVVPPKESLKDFPITDELPIIEVFSYNGNEVVTDSFKNNMSLPSEINTLEQTGNTEIYVSSSPALDEITNAESLQSPKKHKKQNENLIQEIRNDEVEKVIKKNYKDKRTFCFYCEKDVSHFSRHLTTWHGNEIEVQRILSHKSKSKEKRTALDALAKRGNYIKNRSSSQLRPVRRLESNDSSSLNDFLPCPHCLGFYKRKSLYRHTKKCNIELKSTNVKRQSAQSNGQTALLLGNVFKHDELLKKELFPRMRADDITLIAKKDILICNYAYSYLKGRRSKGNLDFLRQNTRRLAKLLKFSQEENAEIKGLMDLLTPTFFQLIINGVNKIGCYNVEDDIYESPTVVMNFGTLLKKCCDLAYIYLLQKPNTENRRKEIKILKKLIESQWANELSAQAATNLNSKKWNKEELLPLTSDLKKLKDYLEKTAQNMHQELLNNPKEKAYNTLKEVLYCQIILMNRRRPAEVSQLKVQTYKSVNMDIQQNEFETCLTETEKILLNTCSRIVIRGKRGRGVPILLLSSKMRSHFDFLIEIRDKFVSNNDYIFHTGGKSFIDGTQILYKHAIQSGAENPKCISATKLRKHLATVTQLLQFSNSDLEQLSKFMGHTLRTHCDFYRLSDNTYQTAKISKLLLLATEGGLEKYKGVPLDDIDIDLNPIFDECDTDEILVTEDQDTDSKIMSETEEKQKILKQAWSVEEKKLIAQYFAEHIRKKISPKQMEIIQFRDKYPNLFNNRKWTTIKAVVYNFYTGKLTIPR